MSEKIKNVLKRWTSAEKIDWSYIRLLLAGTEAEPIEKLSPYVKAALKAATEHNNYSPVPKGKQQALKWADEKIKVCIELGKVCDTMSSLYSTGVLTGSPKVKRYYVRKGEQYITCVKLNLNASHHNKPHLTEYLEIIRTMVGLGVATDILIEEVAATLHDNIKGFKPIHEYATKYVQEILRDKI